MFVVIFPSTSSSTLQALILWMFDLIGWVLKLLLSGLKCVLSGFKADENQKLVTCFILFSHSCIRDVLISTVSFARILFRILAQLKDIFDVRFKNNPPFIDRACSVQALF